MPFGSTRLDDELVSAVGEFLTLAWRIVHLRNRFCALKELGRSHRQWTILEELAKLGCRSRTRSGINIHEPISWLAVRFACANDVAFDVVQGLNETIDVTYIDLTVKAI